MPVDDSLPASPLHITHVEVDLRGLDDFRRLVAHELDGNLRPAVDGISAEHRQGVGFGTRIAGGEVQVARLRYHACLNSAVANMAAYIDASEVLISALRRIAREYADADLASAAGSAAVTRELAAAHLAAREAEVRALAAVRSRAWEQKIAQMEDP
jgi:hypothetical protein